MRNAVFLAGLGFTVDALDISEVAIAALEPGELREALPGLDVLRYQAGVVQRSGRPRAVAGIVARRPG